MAAAGMRPAATTSLRCCKQVDRSAAKLSCTLRSSEAEASRLPLSFQHSRLTHPLWPLRQRQADSRHSEAAAQRARLEERLALPAAAAGP